MVVATRKKHSLDPNPGLPCPTCKRPMTALFFSAACDYCDGKVEPDYDRGFVVYRGETDGKVHEEYVFRTPLDAERWRAIMGLEGYKVRAVHSETPFRWRKSHGRVKSLEHADHLFTIFPDRMYEPGPYRAHIAPSPQKREAKGG